MTPSSQIRELNDRIADEALSAKIDRLEQVSGAYFQRLIEDDGTSGPPRARS